MLYLHRFKKQKHWTCSIMDSAPDYGSGGWGFESLQVHQKIKELQRHKVAALFYWSFKNSRNLLNNMRAFNIARISNLY